MSNAPGSGLVYTGHPAGMKAVASGLNVASMNLALNK